jgi:signal transduction histidine kinase
MYYRPSSPMPVFVTAERPKRLRWQQHQTSLVIGRHKTGRFGNEYVHRIIKSPYRLLLTPRSSADDSRQELILNIFLVGALVLSIAALGVTAYNSLTMGASYQGAPPGVLLFVCAIFLSLLIMSRSGQYRLVVYVFLAMFFLAATYPLAAKGVVITQTILIYSFMVVLTGILVGSGAAFAVAAIVSATMLLFAGLTQAGRLHASASLVTQPTNYGDGIVCTIIFLLIALVAWLANRDMRQSLYRAQESEAALTRERDSLEVKVRERTRDLQKAHIEQTMQLQQFAEFGRVSATLVHDLASPLTAVSLSLDQLGGRRQSELLAAARQSTAVMEQYVASARQQLQQRAEEVDFRPTMEIRRHVLPLLQTRARAADVRIVLDLDRTVMLHGNSAQFDHIVCNLITNAIDAYDGVTTARPKTVTVSLKPQGKYARLTVHDQGVGISPGKLPHVFDAFYTSKYAPENLGLGLSIVKQTVEADFGGQITASSRRGNTSFKVLIPLV